jgi:hypothetical protein
MSVFDQRHYMIALPFFLLALTSCDTGQDPRAIGDIVIIGGGEADGLVVVDAATTEVIARPGPLPRYKQAFALALDSSSLYVTAVGDAGRELIRLDTRSFRVVSRNAMSEIEGGSNIGQLTIHGGRALAVFPSGAKLAVARAYRDGVGGIVVLDANSWDPIDFIHPLYVQALGVEPLPPGPEFPQGALLVIGARQENVQPSMDWLFVIDPLTHGFVDSAAIAPPANDSRRTLRQVLPAPDGRNVYVLGRSLIYRYDLVRREITATVERPSRGQLSISPNGSTLYVSDPGGRFGLPGSGLLFVYNANLEPGVPIDLSEAALNGTPPVTGAAAVGSTNRYVYVVAGTASRGPGYGSQPGRLLIVDATISQLVGIVDLNGWGFWPIFIVPPH